MRAGVLGVIAAAAASAFAVAMTQSAQAQGTALTEAARGAELYEELGCASCHGDRGQGGRAPRLAGLSSPRPAFIQAVRAPTEMMPPYPADAASEADLDAIYAYLRGAR